MILKDQIFKFFGTYAKTADTLKDGDGKGIWERYQETVGEGYDDEVSNLVDSLLDNTIVPETLLSKMLPTMERSLGEPVLVLDDSTATVELLRRKMVRYAHLIANVKSTPVSYEILLRLLGIDSVNITEFAVTTGFDSDVTLDDENRLFDSGRPCEGCAEYVIATTGTFDLSINPEILRGISRIVEYLEPINALLRGFTYNGVEYELFFIVVKIVDGVLFYDNTNDPGITLELTDGILYKDGINQVLYSLSDGILNYNNI